MKKLFNFLHDLCLYIPQLEKGNGISEKGKGNNYINTQLCLWKLKPNVLEWHLFFQWNLRIQGKKSYSKYEYILQSINIRRNYG